VINRPWTKPPQPFDAEEGSVPAAVPATFYLSTFLSLAVTERLRAGRTWGQTLDEMWPIGRPLLLRKSLTKDASLM
jgi:hypothetical protein